MSFDGKSVIVTGAGSGMGRATACRFAERGASVFVVDIDADAATETVDRIENAGGTALAATADVSDSDDVSAFVTRCVDSFGGIDVLHNNAGAFRGEGALAEVRRELVERLLLLGLLGRAGGGERGLRLLWIVGVGHDYSVAPAASEAGVSTASSFSVMR